MKILLVQCPCAYRVAMPSLGLAYLCSFLKENKYEVRILDLSIILYGHVSKDNRKYWDSNNGYCWYLIDIFKNLPFLTEKVYDEFTDNILSTDSDILGFSVLNTSALFTLEIIKRIKSKKPMQKIILGGPNCYNVSNDDNNFKLPNDLQIYADVVVIGEGEKTLLQVIDQVENKKSLEECKGVAIPKKDKWVFTGFTEPIMNLDELPFPNFDAYDLKLYSDKNTLPILTSRGCPMRCVFCTDTYFWRLYRHRSTENVVAEIRRMQDKYKNRFFFFNDSLINGNFVNFSDLCNMLIKEKIDIFWGGNCRIDKRLDSEFLKKMKISGCKYLIVGVESGSNKILKLMHKGFTIEDAECFIYDCNRAGIDIMANWIVGFPGETDEDFMHTAHFIQKNRNLIKENTFNVLALNQFSYLEKHREEFGIVLDTNHLGLWRSVDGLNNIEVRNSRLRYLENLLEKMNKGYHIVRQIERNEKLL